MRDASTPRRRRGVRAHPRRRRRVRRVRRRRVRRVRRDEVRRVVRVGGVRRRRPPRARRRFARGVDDRLEVRVRVRGEERCGRRSTHRRAAVAGRETNGSTEGIRAAEPSDADSDAEPGRPRPGGRVRVSRRERGSLATGQDVVRVEGSVFGSGRVVGGGVRTEHLGTRVRVERAIARGHVESRPPSSRASEGTYMPEIPLRPVYPLA